MSTPLVEIRDLHVDFPGPSGRVPAVRGITLSMGREKLGIVGESGSGKSVTGRALMRLGADAFLDPADDAFAGRKGNGTEDDRAGQSEREAAASYEHACPPCGAVIPRLRSRRRGNP